MFLVDLFRRDPWGSTPKPWWMDRSTLVPPATPGEVAEMSRLYVMLPWLFADYVEQGRYDEFVLWLRGR